MLIALALVVVLNPALTPGAIRPLTKEQICATRWGLDARHVSPAMKRRVLAAYGIAWKDRGGWVVDHLVPRELAGQDVELNLWPQTPADAHAKDLVENRLHKQVCGGWLQLVDAQNIMRNWKGTK